MVRWFNKDAAHPHVRVVPLPRDLREYVCAHGYAYNCRGALCVHCATETGGLLVAEQVFVAAGGRIGFDEDGELLDYNSDDSS
jgi:hypothetical protein